MKNIKKYKKLIALIIFLIIGLSIYGNSFNNEFFWDDDDSIVNNAYIKDWNFLPNYFTENLIAGSGQITNYYRPILLISFAFDYQFWKLNPFGFHFTNTLLHILTAWLIFLLLFKLGSLKNKKENFEEKKLENKNNYFKFLNFFESFVLPFLVGLFFLIHPLQTEAVTYVAGRADSLSSFFGLLSILFFIKYRLNKRKLMLYIFSLIFFILGLLTKEQIILLPGLILLVEVFFITKKFNKKSIVNILKLIFPFFLISLLYFIVRVTILNFNDIFSGFEYDQYYDSSIWQRLLTFCFVIIYYFKLLFIPTGLHMAREVPLISSFFSWPVLLFLFLIFLIIIFIVKTWKKDRFIAFGFIWFFIILLPRTNIFKINRPMYEHWLYLPMVGFWLAFFSLLFLIYKKIKNKLFFLYLVLSFLIVYIFGFSFLTILRNNDWENPIFFYEKNLKYTPNSFIQHNNLGMAYAQKGELEKSVFEYRKAIEIKDVYPQIHHNLANSLRDLGKAEEAKNEYRKAILMSPSFMMPYGALLEIYINNNEKEDAKKILKEMEILFGNNSEFLYLSGAAYYNLEEYQKALSLWRKLLEKDPTNIGIKEMIKKAKEMKNK